MTKDIKKPTLFLALLPVVCLIFFLVFNVLFFEDTLGGANQSALLLAAAVAGVVSVSLGNKWLNVRSSIVKSIGSTMPSILILLLIGALAGTWLISGVVPAMIYYGLKILNPKIFLLASVIITAIVSLATGSSWSTVATIGIALLGIGNALGIKEGITAGAIISGAYFGDKMSPLSDTTNLAPAMAGTDLFTHIRYMTITTFPSVLITMIIFTIMGFTMDFTDQSANIADTSNAINETFNISPWLFLVPVILIAIIIKKMPPLPAIFIGALLGGIFAVIFQPDIIKGLSKPEFSYAKASYMTVMQAMFGDTSIITSNETVNELLSTGGMKGMLNTIWLIMSALIFSGVMESAGLLKKISQYILKLVRSTGSLVASTVGTCFFFNVTSSDQYLAIVVPGRMFAKVYKERGIKPEVLSRTLEDSGTVTSVLIPWNTCGATQSGVLGVSTMAYAPYAFFNLISPFMSILVAYLNIKIRRYTKKEMEKFNLTTEEKENEVMIP